MPKKMFNIHRTHFGHLGFVIDWAETIVMRSKQPIAESSSEPARDKARCAKLAFSGVLRSARRLDVGLFRSSSASNSTTLCQEKGRGESVSSTVDERASTSPRFGSTHRKEKFGLSHVARHLAADRSPQSGSSNSNGGLSARFEAE